jgi:hypothetical protein
VHFGFGSIAEELASGAHFQQTGRDAKSPWSVQESSGAEPTILDDRRMAEGSL